MSVRSRLPALVLLGLVVVAVTLLVAGYGLPVGLGALTGLLLGGIAALGVLNLSTRSGRHTSYGTWSTPLVANDQPDHELMARIGRDAMRVAGVDSGVLRRVIPLGDSVEAAGARVELVALEIREDGCIATLVAHTRPPVGSVGHFVDVAVSDDAGTEYVASGQGSGGSGPGASRHEIRIAPRPPDAARTLSLRIDAFADPFPGPSVELRGPWEFRVAL